MYELIQDFIMCSLLKGGQKKFSVKVNKNLYLNPHIQCSVIHNNFLYLNPGQPRTLLQLKLVGILMINLFLT
jgi:hypothetical protein